MKRNAEKCSEMQRNAEKCREMQRNAEKSREMKRNAVKCSEMQNLAPSYRDLKDPTSRQNFWDTLEQQFVIYLRPCHTLNI